ncbi:hypothetical protein ElyMa_001156300 [Elysia marginata]|uniref:ShKT domain-containing protein n=1 Tax=Elysia marginata TaxID=1093978 RepID=A0AAV4I0X9_9GAST|nr:hypothetical protein ElyMa_001156300 [Elysia marginata]
MHSHDLDQCNLDLTASPHHRPGPTRARCAFCCHDQDCALAQLGGGPHLHPHAGGECFRRYHPGPRSNVAQLNRDLRQADWGCQGRTQRCHNGVGANTNRCSLDLAVAGMHHQCSFCCLDKACVLSARTPATAPTPAPTKTPTTVLPTTTPDPLNQFLKGQCRDVVSTCTPEMCYKVLAPTMCRKFCNLCAGIKPQTSRSESRASTTRPRRHTPFSPSSMTTVTVASWSSGILVKCRKHVYKTKRSGVRFLTLSQLDI